MNTKENNSPNDNEDTHKTPKRGMKIPKKQEEDSAYQTLDSTSVSTTPTTMSTNNLSFYQQNNSNNSFITFNHMAMHSSPLPGTTLYQLPQNMFDSYYHHHYQPITPVLNESPIFNSNTNSSFTSNTRIKKTVFRPFE